jgi:hypothetical protein
MYIVSVAYLILIFKSLPFGGETDIKVPFRFQHFLSIFPIGLVALSWLEYLTKFKHIKKVGGYLSTLERSVYADQPELGWEQYLAKQETAGWSEHFGNHVFWAVFFAMTLVVYFLLSSVPEAMLPEAADVSSVFLAAHYS